MSHLPDETLQALAEGALAPEAHAPAELHLSDCAECRAILSEYREIFSGLATLPAPPPPMRFTAEVMSRVALHEASLARQRRTAAVTLLGSGVVALVLFAMAGNGALARQITAFCGHALELTRFGHLAVGAVSTVLSAWRLPLFAIAAALCIPTLLALHRSVPARAQAV